MIGFREFLSENRKVHVKSREELVKIVKRDKALKKHIGNRPVYFDGDDLVVGDETAAFNPIWDDGTVEWNKLIKDILDNISPATKKPSADQTVVGKFNVLLPKELAGTLGRANVKLENPRAIVDADDNDANTIKREIHNPSDGIKVRIMKRSQGNKVYIDAKDETSFETAMDKLKNIK